MQDHNGFSGPEQRRFPRINAQYVASYYVYPGHVHRSDMSLAKNLCLGGICFATDKHYAEGTVLHITLRVPKIEHPVEVLGEVVHAVQSQAKSFSFDIGCKFIQISEHDLMMLEAVLRQEIKHTDTHEKN